MESFLSALGVAGLTGLTYLAYRHPAGYYKIIVKIHLVLLGLMVVLLAYGVGIIYGGAAIFEYVEPSKMAKAIIVMDANKPPVVLIISGGVVFYLYTAILTHLQDFVRDSKQENDNPKGNPDD